MTSFSHLKKQLEEYEASLTAEERAERDRRHKETLAELAKQRERMFAPYLEMERHLERLHAMEAALAPMRLAEDLHRMTAVESLVSMAAAAHQSELASSALMASITPQEAIRGLGERAAFLGIEGHPTQYRLMEAALASVREAESLHGMTAVKSPWETHQSQLATNAFAASITPQETIRGLVERASVGIEPHLARYQMMDGALTHMRRDAGLHGMTAYESLAAMATQVNASAGLESPLLGGMYQSQLASGPLQDAFHGLIKPSAADLWMADLLRTEDVMDGSPSTTAEELDSESEPPVEVEDARSENEVGSAESATEGTTPHHGRRLKDRRNAAYRVLVDDIRREPEGSLLIDHMVDRLVTLVDAMRRDIEDGHY